MFRRIKFAEGVHQPHHAGTEQILNRDMLGEPLVNAPGNEAHDRQVVDHELLLLRAQGAGLLRVGGFGQSRTATPILRDRQYQGRNGLRQKAHLPLPFLNSSNFLHAYHPR